MIRNLQSLRALAAFMVVFYHARLLTPVGEILSFDWGNAGVDVFFLISGFIIAHVARRDDVGRPGAFLLKRAIRVAPLYWLLTLALFAVAQKAPSLAGAGGRPDLAMLAKSLFFVPYYNAANEPHPILFMGWTLNYEAFFYLVFAACLLIRREAARLAAASAALAMLVAAGAVLRPEGAVGRTYTDPMMLEFVAGMWINRGWRALPPRAVSPHAVAACRVAGLAAVTALVAGDYLWPDVAREVKWGLPSLLLFLAVMTLERGGVAIGNRWLLLLGEASYAIYLTHPFVIKAASLAYARLQIAALPIHVAALLVLYAVVAVVGITVHLLVEKPVIRWLRHRLAPRDPPSVATGDMPAAA